MDKIDNSERIDRFFREQMSLEERNTFLEDLKNDKELREEAQITALLIQELKEERSKQEQEIAQEIRRDKSFITSRRVIYWVCSIAALFVFFFGSVHFYQMRQMDNLYDEYYEPKTTSRSASDSIEQKLAILYNKIDTVKDVTTTIQEIQFISDSICEFDNYEYSLQASEITWYIALAYIKDHQKDKAIALLKTLVEDSNFGQDAKAILKQLE